MRLARPALALALLFPGFAAADSWTDLPGGWGRYANERFGTIIEVPMRMFILVEPAPENRDGREFRTEDGARLWVSGTFAPSALMSSFEDYKRGLLSEAKQRLDVTYEKSGKGWLVFSGRAGSRIVYTKLVEGCEAAHEFTIEYPADRKTVYDPLVTRLSRTLSCRRPRTR